MTNAIKIRRAEERDLPQLLDIYNYEVLNGVATFDINPKTIDQWRIWLREHNRGNHPLIVATDNNDLATGYASLSEYRTKEAYRQTAELSVYVSPEHRGKGIANALLKAIIEIAKSETDLHTIVSVITSGNEISTRLHLKYGFAYCGTMNDVGMKWGRWLGIDNYTLHI